MRLLVTGGSSFVGASFCREAARRHDVLALYHSTPLVLNGVTPVRADLRQPESLRRVGACDVDAVIHIASTIHVAGAPDPSAAAVDLNRRMMDTVLGIGRPIVYASSTVVHWEQRSPYRSSRLDDEARLRSSGLHYAIVRPSAPYGPRLVNHRPRHTESFHTLADLVRRAPVVPVIGDGRYQRQPVHVADFALSILGLLDKGLPDAAFDAGGADALSFDAIIDAIAAAAGRRVLKLHLPKALFVQLARLSPDFDPTLIATIDADDVAEPGPLAAASGHQPRSFAQGARDLL